MMKRLPPAAAIALIVGLIWLVPAQSLDTSDFQVPHSTSGLALAPPGKDPTPGPTPTCQPRKGVFIGTNRSERLEDYGDISVICGRGGNDTIIVRKLGTIVWGGPGNDTINTWQAAPEIANEIQAGEGRDKATVDRWDSWKGVESIRTTRKAGSPATSADANGLRYPAVQPRIQCRIVDGERRMLFEPTPQMRAADATSRVDWQSVAWSPVLTYYNPQTQQWEFVIQNEWLWDRTYDESISAFKGNVWRRFTTSEEWHLWFFANYPRFFFKVAVYYYHYAEAGVPANRVYAWVEQYAGEYATADGKACYFR